MTSKSLALRFRSTFWKIHSFKRKIIHFFDEKNFSVHGSLLFILSCFLCLYVASTYIEHKLLIQKLIAGSMLDIKYLRTFSMVLFPTHLLLAFIIYGTAIMPKVPKLRSLLWPMIGYALIEVSYYKTYLRIYNYFDNLLSLFFSFGIILLVAFMRHEGFGIKVRYNLTLRNFVEIFTKKKKVLLLHNVKYRVSHRGNNSLYETSLVWSMEKRVQDDTYLDRIIDYDKNGNRYEYDLKKRAYNVHESQLELETVESPVIVLDFKMDIESHMRQLEERGWTLPYREHLMLDFIGIFYMDLKVFDDQKLNTTIEEIIEKKFKLVSCFTTTKEVDNENNGDSLSNNGNIESKIVETSKIPITQDDLNIQNVS